MSQTSTIVGGTLVSLAWITIGQRFLSGCKNKDVELCPAGKGVNIVSNISLKPLVHVMVSDS